MDYIKCLSIAGFDSSGGAGIQADIKTFSATGSYAMTVLTAVPVQNTMGVKKIYQLPLSCIQEQMQAIFEDCPPDAIKLGMLFSSEIIIFLSEFLQKYAQNIPLILDPVMHAKSGNILLEKSAIESLKNNLIPLMNLVTPNLPEAHILTGAKDLSQEDLAEKILDLGCRAVLVKGGHDSIKKGSHDFFISHQQKKVLEGERILSSNTHGTGCTLSSAITSFIAQGFTYLESCEKAKIYVSEAIRAGKDKKLGKGKGPVHHFYHFW